MRGWNPGGGEIFRTCPDRPWGSPSLLHNGYRFFPGGKERSGRDTDSSPPSSAVVLKEHSPYGPYGLYRASVPVQGCTLPLLFLRKLFSIVRLHIDFTTVHGIIIAVAVCQCCAFLTVWPVSVANVCVLYIDAVGWWYCWVGDRWISEMVLTGNNQNTRTRIPRGQVCDWTRACVVERQVTNHLTPGKSPNYYQLNDLEIHVL